LRSGQSSRRKINAYELRLRIALLERKQAVALTTASIQNHRGRQAHRLKPLHKRTLNLPGNKVVPRPSARPSFELPANRLGI
jgi:hypothetical protein